MQNVDDPGQAGPRFLAMVEEALAKGELARLTLGAPIGPDRTLKSLLIRPIEVRDGARLSFVFRHKTRDVTKNFPHAEGLRRLAELVGSAFRTAHLCTTQQTVHLEFRSGREPSLSTGPASAGATVSLAHDLPKQRALDPATAPWLQDLGVLTSGGGVAKGMEPKLRQIQKFTELLQHLVNDLRVPLGPAGPPDPMHAAAAAGISPNARKITVADMGCGKGYLTFAMHDWLRRQPGLVPDVLGVECRPELVDAANATARKHRLAGLRFEAGDIASAALEGVGLLVALHACDIATDEAIARGIEAGAALIVVSPCCHKELRPHLQPPLVLANALRHGILLERQAEFVTDALRAGLMEWAGYDTRVFEFISTEHTSKNLMIVGLKRRIAGPREEAERRVRDLARFYGIRSQRLAALLNFPMDGGFASLT